MVKKIYNWILNTMDQQAEYITYQDHQYLTCDLKSTSIKSSKPMEWMHGKLMWKSQKESEMDYL